MTKVFVLTEEYNDYDQHGAYFVEVFARRPTNEELTKAGVEAGRLSHVQAGGGRQGFDDHWYILDEVELK